VRKLVALLVVSLASSVLAAAPSEGVPLQVRRGFFTETDIGGFFTVGGDNAYSNLQTYLQLGAGYQLTVGNGSGLIPIGVHVAIGANAQNCWSGLTSAGVCTKSDNFTLIFVSASGGYLHRVIERLYVGGKILAGWTFLDPAPVASAGQDVTGGINAGLAASIEYATNMDHFSIGLDVAARFVIGPNIFSLSFYPRVQYTF
jgi:hypothetical protein